MNTFYRIGKTIAHADGRRDTFPTINAAKRESRKNQKAGMRYVAPGQVSGIPGRTFCAVKGD